MPGEMIVVACVIAALLLLVVLVLSKLRGAPTQRRSTPARLRLRLVYFVWLVDEWESGDIFTGQLQQISACQAVLTSMHSAPVHVVISAEAEEDANKASNMASQILGSLLGSVRVHGTDTARWEHFGIRRVWELCRDETMQRSLAPEEELVGYMHSKGMSSNSANLTSQIRDLFEYTFGDIGAIVTAFADSEVRKAALLCGCDRSAFGWLNFWIARATALAERDAPDNMWDDRYSYEHWLGMDDSGCDHGFSLATGKRGDCPQGDPGKYPHNLPVVLQDLLDQLWIHKFRPPWARDEL